tara:strand:- start:6728 stop:8260 length:1533 start_codon:yes stop_codon:yes gene_type:complete
MGIPSYFSHIVKEHRKIIKEYKHFTVDNLYLDSNSIIYDTVYKLDKEHPDFENELIKLVCKQIEQYILLIQPRFYVYIAFDGVAPVAKLEQQRNRRYKTMFEKKILSMLDNTNNNSWDTTQITPGTNFMNLLSKSIHKYFNNPQKFNVQKIFISCSDEHGEGEHKIYEFIRNNEEHHITTTTVIYGLDADLIMLSLNHLHICPNMYLFRETPHFIKTIDKTLNPHSNYLIDIPLFNKILSNELNGDNRIFDYIFLCFFLGNDFLPHFPALNIRTTGIDRLLSAYRKVTRENVVCGSTIIWKNLRKIIQELASHEEQMFKDEYQLRSKQSKFIKHKEGDNEQKLQSLPLKNRSVEFYINPYENGWEKRYYSTLFDIDIDDDRRKQICINYLQGLEWTLKYYTTGCVDWRWKYNYNYPPLLTDLIKYIPYFHTTMVPFNSKQHVSEYVQLSYVLPKKSLYLIPSEIKDKLLQKHPEWYTDNYDFCWAFCKYFWESHPKMPYINIDQLELLCN